MANALEIYETERDLLLLASGQGFAMCTPWQCYGELRLLFYCGMAFAMSLRLVVLGMVFAWDVFTRLYACGKWTRVRKCLSKRPAGTAKVLPAMANAGHTRWTRLQIHSNGKSQRMGDGLPSICNQASNTNAGHARTHHAQANLAV